MKEPSTLFTFVLGTISGIVGTIVVEVLFRLYDAGSISNKITQLIVSDIAFRKIKRIPYLCSIGSEDPQNMVIAEWLSSSYSLFSNDEAAIQKGLESLDQLSDILDIDLRPISFNLIKHAFKHNKYLSVENKYLKVMGKMNNSIAV